MAQTRNKNTEYEQFTRKVFAGLSSQKRVKTIKLQHNVKLLGNSGTRHQIDVYWEYEKDGQLHKAAIECKNYSKNVPIGKVRDLLCLIDTDALATTISVSSSTKNRLLCIKRWHEDQNTHKIGLLDIDSPLYQPTEIEEVLEPQLFYTALETCINKYGTDSEKNAFGAFELDGSVEFSRIKGDNSMLNHLGNGRNIREDKKTIMDFIEKMKSQIASEYVQLPKTGRQLSWVDTIKNLLS